MTKMGNGCMLICLGLVLVLGVLAAGSAQAGLFDVFKRNKSKADTTAKEFLVVFPFDQVTIGNVPQTFGQDIASSLKSLIAESPNYNALLYTDRLPPVKREGLKDEDVKGPFCEDRSKAQYLASLLATNYYVVGEVQEVQVDQARKVAQVTLSADLYMLKGKNSKLVKTYLVTGKSPENTKATEEDELRALAAGDAVSKLAIDLAKSPEAKQAEAAVADGVVPATVDESTTAE